MFDFVIQCEQFNMKYYYIFLKPIKIRRKIIIN